MSYTRILYPRNVSIQKILGGVPMNMKTIKSKTCLCMCCMEEHEVKTVLVDEKRHLKGKQ